MALSRDKALQLARDIFYGPRAEEAPRLEMLSRAVRPCGPDEDPRVEIPRDAPLAVKRLARKSETNYLPLVLDIYTAALKVDGYYSKGSANTAAPWEHWQRNNLDGKQTGVHRGALHYGASYASALPGMHPGQDLDPTPVVQGISPRAMTALYADPTNDEWPLFALHVNGNQVLLYDEEVRYRFGIEKPSPRSAFDKNLSTYVPGGFLTYIDTEVHGVGVCPVVRFRDRMLLEGEETFGIVEPLLRIQDRINETTFGMLVTQFFQAFKQRYILGWVPESEQEYLKATASDVWTFDDFNVKVGQLEASDPGGYISTKASAVRDLSAIAQVPAQNLGIDGISNISDATLAGLEISKDRKADEIGTSLGESWEQLLRICSHISGDGDSAADYTGEVRWKDSTARSFAQTVDGLGKLATMLGVPQELLWEDIPGWTQQKVDRAKELRQETDALANLTTLLDQQTNGNGPAAG